MSLIEGEYISIYKDLVDEHAKKITHVIKPGDLVITEPKCSSHNGIYKK